MANLFGQVLRQVIKESEEDSAAKYQKDIDAVKKVGEFIDKNEDKFKKDFIKYFYQENGLTDTNNTDDSSQEEYQKSGAWEVGWYFVYYINKLLGIHPNEHDTKISEYNGTYIVRINTYLNLPFVGFSVTANLSITPNKSNKPGKKFIFDINLDDSDMYLFADETHDESFKIPDEEQIDILKYRDYAYRQEKEATKIDKESATFKSKYANADTARFIGMAAYDVKKKQRDPKTKSEVEKFNTTILKAVMKHTKLTSEDNEFKTRTSWHDELTSVYTNLGFLYVETYLSEGEFASMQKVVLYFKGRSEDKVVLYDIEEYNKS